MLWHLESIKKIIFIYEHVLPTIQCVLSDGSTKRTVEGWLPCHHQDVQYELVLSTRGKIVSIVDMARGPKKKRGLITKTMKRIGSSKKFAPRRYKPDTYLEQAEKAYEWTALWTCSVIYSSWDIQRMDINQTFGCLNKDIESICQHTSIASRPRFFQYNTDVKRIMKKALRQMGKPERTDWAGFDARLKWATSTDTASKETLPSHIRNVQHYQELWTTVENIAEAKRIGTAFRPDNVTLVIGSPCPSIVDRNAFVVVRTLEDAYRWKCEVDWGTICLLTEPTCSRERLVELGVSDIRPLESKKVLYMPWAHCWGQREWLSLAEIGFEHVTCIGRLDQWPLGRGQVFRDMVTSKQFDSSTCLHAATDCVHMVHTDDLQATVDKVRDIFKVVQCFSNEPRDDIDCGRRLLTKPFRIRTLRPSSDVDLYEEQRVHEPDRIVKNVSVKHPRAYRGLKVNAGVYICSDKTTPFDVHVARTYCRHALYVLNCKTCLFSMHKEAPPRITINPFLNII